MAKPPPPTSSEERATHPRTRQNRRPLPTGLLDLEVFSRILKGYPSVMKSIALIAKPHSELLSATLAELVPLFLDRGWKIHGSEDLAQPWQKAGLTNADLKDLPEQGQPMDLCLVLGGDGTLLRAARHFGTTETPLLGINLGSLGFLTAHPAKSAKKTLQLYFQGKLRQEKRSLLSVELFRNHARLLQTYVLNDAVLSKGALARIMTFNVQIDQVHAARMQADGLIVATPTGSTAYSLSAGGPILHPSLDAWVLSPICPHSLTLRPTVVPNHLEVTITLENAEDAHLTLDGQVEHPLKVQDQIKLQKAKHGLTLLQNPELPFFKLLQEKLHWSNR